MADPMERYRDKVDPRHREAMQAIGMAAMILTPHADQLERLLKAEREAHSILHIVDPTLYRDMIGSKNFAQQIELARAAQAFLLAAQAVADDLLEPADG